MSVVIVLAQFAVAAGLFAAGRWGRGVSATDFSVALPTEERERRAAACRRGATACMVCAVLVSLASVLTAAQVVADLRRG